MIGGAGFANAAFTTPALIVGQPIEAGPNAGAAMAAVWDGAAFMTVWSDDRSGQAGIYGARVATDGTLLNHPNLVLVTDHTNLDYPADAPALAFDGTNFLLAWRQQDNVWAQRIDRTGKALDAKPSRVSSGASGGVGKPSVVFDGTNYLVVMRERYSDTMWNEVRATRVSPAGVLLDKSSVTVRFTLVKDAPLVGDPVARAGSAGTLIAWAEAATGGSVSMLGTVIPAGAMPTQITTPIAIATDAGFARSPVGAELDGTGFFVAWTESATGAAVQDIRGRSVSASADLGAPTTLLTGVSSAGAGLTADGQSWLLGWYDVGADRRARATVARVDRTGSPLTRATLDEQGLTLSSGGLSLPIAAGAGQALAVWQAQVGSRHVPHAAPVPKAAGATVAGTRLAYALSRQSYPAMASDGQGYLVVWTEQRDTGFGLFGARVDVQRGVLDGTGFPIWSGAFGAFGPAVASSGDGYLVAWTTGTTGVRARSIAADGTLRGAQEIAVSNVDAPQPIVGVSGGVYLLAWACTTSAVCLTRLSAAGALLDATPNQVSTGGAYPSILRVSGSTGQFLVIWNDLQAKGTRAVRINPTTGALLDPTGTLLPALGTEPAGTVCGVASSGDQYLLVWKRALGGIVAARLSPDLTWQDTAPLAFPHRQENSHIDLEDYPSVVWGGTDYIIAWRNQVQTIYVGDPTLESLGFTHVSTQGALVGNGANVYSGVAGFLTPATSFSGPPLAAGVRHVLVGDTVVDSGYGYKVSRNRAWLSSAAGDCPDALCAQPVIGLPDGGTAPDAGPPPDSGSSRDGGASSGDAADAADAGGSASPDAALGDAPPPDVHAPVDGPPHSGEAGHYALDARSGSLGADGCSCAVADPLGSPTSVAGLLLLAIFGFGWTRRRSGRRR